MARRRFGISINQSAAPGADPVREARRAEELGFDFVSVTDHLHGTRPTHETWTLLTWIAASTTRVGLLTDVIGLLYRPPVVLAKMAASLVGLSGGRLTLGLGAGGTDEEFRGFGLTLRRGADRPRRRRVDPFLPVRAAGGGGSEDGPDPARRGGSGS